MGALRPGRMTPLRPEQRPVAQHEVFEDQAGVQGMMRPAKLLQEALLEREQAGEI
ncbi:MAG: hypothetical protein RL322_1400, partial [Pseudomonadota bacterium]